MQLPLKYRFNRLHHDRINTQIWVGWKCLVDFIMNKLRVALCDLQITFLEIIKYIWQFLRIFPLHVVHGNVHLLFTRLVLYILSSATAMQIWQSMYVNGSWIEIADDCPRLLAFCSCSIEAQNLARPNCDHPIAQLCWTDCETARLPFRCK